MKKSKIIIMLTGICAMFLSSFKSDRQPPVREAITIYTYAGNSPCGNFIKPILGIPRGADCERVQWKLLLYEDDLKQPVGFKLAGSHGMQQQGGPGFIGGGKSFSVEGNWQLTKGSKADPEAGVYKLVTKNGGHTLRFVKMSDDVIHLLYTDGSLMIGNGGWSYTLNRVKQ